jgi:parallel beta-helix repeat protein
MTEANTRALIPQRSSSLAVTSRLAERTLVERAVRSDALRLIGRTLVVGPGGYSTIGEAVASAQDGDTVLLRPGIYREKVTISRAITVTGDGHRDAIVVESDDAPSLILDNATARVTNLTIQGGGAFDEWGGKAAVLVTGGVPILDGIVLAESYGIRIRKAPSEFSDDGEGASPSIRGCVIRDGPRAGIWADPFSTGTIEHNEIFGNALFGIVVWGTGSAPLVRANRIHDNDGGVWVNGSASPIIEDNDIYGNSRRGVWVDRAAPLIRANRIGGGQRYGIMASGAAAGTIEDNDIFGNVDGIAVTDVGGTPVIQANRLYGNSGVGITVPGDAGGTNEDNDFARNAGGDIRVDEGRPRSSSRTLTNDLVRESGGPINEERVPARGRPQGSGPPSATRWLAERTLADRVARRHSAIKVLIVDDIVETRNHLTKVLGFESGIEVVGVAATGIESLELARGLDPDIVLMDIMMPEMDGLTATEILLERMPEVSVVMMSIMDDTYRLRRAMRVGAREYLLKPFSLNELVTAIRDAQTTRSLAIQVTAPRRDS